jgi:hypothetical protein
MEPLSGRYLDNIEPATGKPHSQVADSDTRAMSSLRWRRGKGVRRLAACQVKAAMKFLHSVMDEAGGWDEA